MLRGYKNLTTGRSTIIIRFCCAKDAAKKTKCREDTRDDTAAEATLQDSIETLSEADQQVALSIVSGTQK